MNKQKPTIAIYSGVIPSTSFIERLIESLANENHTIYLFGIKKRRINYKMPIKTIGYYNKKHSKLYLLIKFGLLLFLFKTKTKNKLDSILKKQNRNTLYHKVKYYPVLWYKPDVFHVQWAKSLRDWMWVQEFGIKLVLSLRGAHINYSPVANVTLADMYKRNFPKVDGFHAVSEDIAKEALIYGAEKNKIKVVYSGLDIKPTNNLLSKTVSNEFKILSVGRNHWKKGYHYALDACKILKDNNFNFNYTIIGANNDIELLYQVRDLGLEREVILLENMPFNEVLDYMQHTDLLLLPSVEEGVANVVLEAMALGKTVLTSNCGGMEEVITHKENGFVFPLRNVQELIEQIRLISMLSIEEKKVISKNAIKTINDNHSVSQMSNSMIELYKTVILE